MPLDPLGLIAGEFETFGRVPALSGNRHDFFAKSVVKEEGIIVMIADVGSSLPEGS